MEVLLSGAQLKKRPPEATRLGQRYADEN
ncbi:hypothetical protein LEMLEM_LOCUS16723 [Lemmus lemmus]